MTDRFKWFFLCALVLGIQLAVFFPYVTITSADTRPGGNNPPGNSAFNNPAATVLNVDQNASSETVVAGETISYTLKVVNTSRHAVASNIRVMDMPPDGFRYKSGSVQLNGNSWPEPAISSNGQNLIFKIGNLQAQGSAIITFSTEVTADRKAGKAVNYVSAISNDGGNSNFTRFTVTVQNMHQPGQETSPAKNSTKTVIPPANDLPLPAATTRTEVPQPEAVVPSKTESVTTLAQAPLQRIDPPSITPPPEEPPMVTVVSGKEEPGKSIPPVPDTAVQTEKPATPEVDKKPAVSDAPKSDNFISGNFSVPKQQTLAELVGKSEVPVVTDFDGNYIKNMSDTSITGNVVASHTDNASISESIRVGRGFNRESLAAMARTEQAKAQTGQAFGLLLPSVSVRANYGAELSDPSVVTDLAGRPLSPVIHSRTDASLNIRQPLFDLPSFLDWRRRGMLEKARGENFRISDGDAYISVVNAYLAMVSSRLQADLTRDFETQLTELHTYIEKRAKAGAASISDMSRVRARSQATQSSRLEQESAHAAAGIEFVRLTNIVPTKIRIPVLEDLEVPSLPKTFDTAVAAAMKQNPDLATLQAEIQAADIDIKSSKGRYLPRVDAEYTDSFSLHAGGDTSSAGQRDMRLMMVLNWNLYSGGSDYKAAVERTAKQKELQYRFDDQRRRIVQSLSAQYATLSSTRERIVSGYQELKAITTAAEAMSKRMLSGNQSLLDLLDVYDRYYQVRSRLVSLHLLEMNTVAQLVRLTIGTPGVEGITTLAKGGK